MLQSRGLDHYPCQVPVNSHSESDSVVAELLDDTMLMCRSVLVGAWGLAWRAGCLSKCLIDMEKQSLQRQFQQVERRPEDMRLACEHHRRRLRYDEHCAQLEQCNAILNAERTRWPFHVASMQATASKSLSSCENDQLGPRSREIHVAAGVARASMAGAMGAWTTATAETPRSAEGMACDLVNIPVTTLKPLPSPPIGVLPQGPNG